MSTSSAAIRSAEIRHILHGKPAASRADLPPVWINIAMGTASTGLTDQACTDYVEAAQLFRYHRTPLAMESLSAIGNDFALECYPDFSNLDSLASNDIEKRTAMAVTQLFEEFGYNVPASFYNVILASTANPSAEVGLKMFHDESKTMRDRLWDAVLHAMLLVTPIGLRVQSIISQQGIRFFHVMDCGCGVKLSHDMPFNITLDEQLKSAYLQNLVAASFEQYGVNATTSAKSRGF